MLKLHAGVSKKVGLPGFSSASASCTIEAELDSSLLQDHEGFQVVVQRAYQSCEKAVQDQIARLTSEPQSEPSQPQEVVEVRTSSAISGARITTNGAATKGAELAVTNRAVFRDAPSPRPATASQVRALRAIAARRKIDLIDLLRDRFGLITADELGIRQASNLIDELKGDEPTSSPSANGNGALAKTGGCSMIARTELLPVLTPTKPAITNPANEVAKTLTGRDCLSWSAISTFRTCPLKYKFRYVDGLPEESVSSALVFGTGIHMAIEQHFQSILSGDPKPELDVLLFAYRSAWLPHDPDAISFGSTETRASLDTLASKMLTAFLNSPTASVQGRVLGVEEEIRGMLVEGVPGLYGRVDLLTEDSDSLVVTDIKTSRSKWSQEQFEDSGEQLLLYSKLASEISPGKKIATRFLVLTKTREPQIEERTREVNPAAVKRTLAGVERVWRAIESGVFYPAPSIMSCSSCCYRAACRAWAG